MELPAYNKTLNIYTDASFSKEHQIGVAGFLLLTNDFLKPFELLKTFVVKEKNNIRIELSGFILAIQSLTEIVLNSENTTATMSDFKINAYTDCKAISDLLKRRIKLESSNFISSKSGNILSNTDLYKEILRLHDCFHFDIIWVKGHSPQRNQTLIQKNFSRIDKLCRKELRSLEKENRPF